MHCMYCLALVVSWSYIYYAQWWGVACTPHTTPNVWLPDPVTPKGHTITSKETKVVLNLGWTGNWPSHSQSLNANWKHHEWFSRDFWLHIVYRVMRYDYVYYAVTVSKDIMLVHFIQIQNWSVYMHTGWCAKMIILNTITWPFHKVVLLELLFIIAKLSSGFFF